MRDYNYREKWKKLLTPECLQRAAVVPYLLRNADITRSNQAWSIDITYIPMKHGFLYLTAIIDWHSRCIVGWELDDTLDTRVCIEACNKAFRVARPEMQHVLIISLATASSVRQNWNLKYGATRESPQL